MTSYDPDLLMTDAEVRIIESFVLITRNLGGAMAEVGVYKGHSASVIAKHMYPEQKLFLFDTFEGIPNQLTPHRDKPNKWVAPGMYAANEAEVRARFADSPNVIITRGIFPASAQDVITDQSFSFVHLDVDLFQPKLDALYFFSSRMVNKGEILVHDFDSLQGVQDACYLFINDRKIPFKLSIIHGHNGQAIFIKVD